MDGHRCEKCGKATKSDLTYYNPFGEQIQLEDVELWLCPKCAALVEDELLEMEIEGL